MNTRRITIINQDSGYLMIDIANSFANKGIETTIIAGRIVERNIPLNKNIKIDKIVRYNRKSILMRIITWITGFVQIWLHIITKHRDEELLIVSNPPFAPLVALFCKNKFNVLIFDLYIETLQEFHPFGNKSILVHLWKKLHKVIFNRAKTIFVLTEGMKQNLEKYISGKDIGVLTLWTDNKYIKPINRVDNHFIKQLGIENKFIVLYSGNIGYSSGVEDIVKLAERFADNRNICFLIIGDGILKSKIQDRIKYLNLNNCILLPWQEQVVLPYSLAAAHVSIVSLSANSSNNSIPSKVHNYISVGSPILCIADSDSDISKFVLSNNIGRSFKSNELDLAAGFIQYLYNNPNELVEIKKHILHISGKFTSRNAWKYVQHITRCN